MALQPAYYRIARLYSYYSRSISWILPTLFSLRLNYLEKRGLERTDKTLSPAIRRRRCAFHAIPIKRSCQENRPPQQLFLPKLPPLRDTRFFCSISLLSSACLCRIFVGSVSALLHQAPIGIKVLFVFRKHPFRTSGPEYRRYHTVSKGRYNRHGSSTTVGLTAWTANASDKGLCIRGERLRHSIARDCPNHMTGSPSPG